MKALEFIDLAMDKIIESNSELGILKSELELVWFNHTIRNKKALFTVITEDGSKDRYFEVTHCHAESCLIVDEYLEVSKTSFSLDN